MTNKTPIFPIPQPHHFSDYGFDPQIDYFQVLEEARKHKRESSRSINDALHFKLQKPISKEDSKKISKKSRKKRWWKNPLHFFKWTQSDHKRPPSHSAGVHPIRPISGPLYFTDTGSTTPYRTTSRPSSGPIAGTMTASGNGDLNIPYISLRELNMEQQHRSSTSALPIYMVT